MLLVLFTSGALNNPVLFDMVVEHWLLAIDRDCIAVGLSFESPPVCIKSTTVLLDSFSLLPKDTVANSALHYPNIEGGIRKL